MTQTKAKTVILDPHPSLHKDSMPADPKSKEIKDLIATMRKTLKSGRKVKSAMSALA
jgi:hypothetical protein